MKKKKLTLDQMIFGFGVPVTEQSKTKGRPTMIEGLRLVMSRKRGGSIIIIIF